MDKLNFLGNGDIDSIEHLYNIYKTDPKSLDEGWYHFFEGFEFALRSYGENGNYADQKLDKEFKVLDLINAYRKRGHLFTKTNPVRARRKYEPTLDLINFGLDESDLDTHFHAGTEIDIGNSTLREIIEHLEETYCDSIGSEYMFIRNPEKITWLQKKIESSRNKTVFSIDEKKHIFRKLLEASGFEHFIHKRFTGQKRFSIEGCETFIPALYYLIDKGSELGIEECLIGMAHRGRLNVLCNIAGKPYEKVFQEFAGEEYVDSIVLGDVKYHLGYENINNLTNDRAVCLQIAPNPSHLEAVAPVVEGISRARIDQKYGGDHLKVLPRLIHGDAAIAGQGIVYEVVQMSQLKGYGTGGTIHIVINNQVGFTTNYLDARTSTYCTDIGKVIKSPIFHVNGDDVEAIVHVVRLAMEYRHTFCNDVFIDILSYRKYGHNEGDEPRYTQPTLYKAIENHPNPRDIYASALRDQQIYTRDEIAGLQADFDNHLEEKYKISKSLGKVSIQKFLYADWRGIKHATPEDFREPVNTTVTKETINYIAEKINFLPEGNRFLDKTVKLVNQRMKLISEGKADWALAEHLAYGSLLMEGHPVRISGQDSVRGTFAHRHAAYVIEDTDNTFIPLENVSPSQASFSIYNSPLNEYGVLGFEYGYALATPKGLTVWEAQYGDFANVAQVIVDQFISSAEEKWGTANGLVLFLPHGYEGQGPEHSSGRIERFLLLAANNNMQIVNPTTPANFFHLLRLSVKRSFRVPLIVFTPKSLLRNDKTVSDIDELAMGRFSEVIDDENVDVHEVRRLVFCSGKVYYDLLSRKEEFQAKDVAIVRLEQLHPFPARQVNEIIKKFPDLMLTLWVQEEPINMGAWRHIAHEFRNHEILPVCRQASGSPATGLLSIHRKTQEEIIQKVFRKCVCDRKLKYCGLQCSDGSYREEVLKQYRYFNINNE